MSIYIYIVFKLTRSPDSCTWKDLRELKLIENKLLCKNSLMKSICSFDNCVKKSAECGCQMSLLLVCFASRTPREFEVNQLKLLWIAKNLSFVVQFCFQILNGTTSKRLSKGVFYQVKNIYCTDNYFHDIIRVYIWRKNWTWLLNSKHKSITKLVIWLWPVERLHHTRYCSIHFKPLVSIALS